MLSNASAMAIRIDAPGLLIAMVGFSPTVNTSPLEEVYDLKLIE